MATYVGVQHGLGALVQSASRDFLLDVELSDDELRRLARVRAFEVPRLVATSIACNQLSGFADAVREHLDVVCPGPAWEIDSQAYWPLPKYAFFHTSVAAPVDATSAQPMALELYGRLRGVAGVSLVSAEGKRWLELRDQARRDAFDRCDNDRLFELNNHLPGPLWVEIEVATYANVCFCGVGIPIYV